MSLFYRSPITWRGRLLERKVSRRFSRATWCALVCTLTLVAYTFEGAGETGKEDYVWRDCTISELDRWVPANNDSLPARMQRDYERRYSCTARAGARSAARFSFSSDCMKKPFDDIMEIRECLRGRRVILFGDSLAAQQADSLVGMLGWRPAFLQRDNPLSQKKEGEDGETAWALNNCYRAKRGGAGTTNRCYDLYSADFASSTNPPPPRDEGPERVDEAAGGGRRRGLASDLGGGGRAAGTASRALQDLHSHVDEEDDGGQGQISVHLRAWPGASLDDWLVRALRDFNGTRPSDVIVINFGPHYRWDSDSEAVFQKDVGNILLAMGSMSDQATMVWREIAPTHFPVPDGSYAKFIEIPRNETVDLCCTGTPPLIYYRNQWVDDFLEENKLQEKVKVLRIHQMSWSRPAAHRTCYNAPPGPVKARKGKKNKRLCRNQSTVDCRHWSEPGVVEEWNRLMLNHLCPS